MKSKLLVFACLLVFCAPVFVFADPPGPPVITATQQAQFIPLVGIPGIPNPSTLQFGDYINSLYRLAISIAALLAVFKIVIAGAKYMLDDVVTHKQEAKEEIKGALVGLLIILGAVLILNTVNTDITKNMIAIDTVQVNASDTISALIAQAEKAAQDAKNLCTLAGANCVAYECYGIENDAQTNESSIDACNRMCTSVLKGKFQANTMGLYMNTDGSFGAHWEWGTAAAVCVYDKSQAATCDANSSYTCCTQSKGGTWLNNKTCQIGDVITLPDGNTQENCIAKGDGFEWDAINNVCRAKVQWDFYPVPSNWNDGTFGLYNDKSGFCQDTQRYPIGTTYDTTTDSCKVSKATAPAI